MRVLQIHNTYVLPGGEDVVADVEAQALRGMGHDVQEVRIANPIGRRAQVGAMVLAPWNPIQNASVRAKAAGFVPDVAHLHNTWFALSPAVVHGLHSQGIPVVMTLHNYRLVCANALLFRDGAVCTECLTASHWRGARHGCYRGSRTQSAVAALTMGVSRSRHTWSLIEQFLVPSHFVASVFAQAGFPADRLTVRPNVSTDPGPRQSPPSRSGRVLYVGRLSPEKGLDILLDAWASARPAGLTLVVVGDGPLRESLEARTVDGVEFVGHASRDEVRRQLLDARALVLPTQWYENFGRVVVEAMAAGLPVLASRIATPAEVVGSLGPQWLVEPTDVADWAAGLTRLTDDRAVDAAGRRARAIWSRSYDETVGMDHLLEVYEAAIGTRARRAS